MIADFLRAIKPSTLIRQCGWTLCLLPFFTQANTNPDELWRYSCPLPTEINNKPMVAIIIDDLGYQMDAGRRLLAMDSELTFAIIPFTPYGTRLAELAHQHKREIMVHAPMETLESRPWEPALRAEMDRDELITLSTKMLGAVPYASGLNNHGGSLLTQRQEHMNWLMDMLVEQQIYFIDSRTTADSVASEIARQTGVPQGARDIFLDNIRRPEAIRAQLKKAQSLARKRGFAVAIGHPYPETLAVLEQQLPQLKVDGIQLVRVSTLLEAQQQQATIAQKTTHTELPTAYPAPK
ncbi:divergent polysaccharide deacetylase family protein [Teredinibacter haidensis]|uniref:divergent polysaccharide deacetylase family protein n=1 Tax=Teredinibacter haidensis TaxID=2731755 RepID=UPI000948982E|nr:divergent polysaccharide deacetylase family protein [Teredinibacter haidensis]